MKNLSFKLEVKTTPSILVSKLFKIFKIPENLIFFQEYLGIIKSLENHKP